MWHGRYVALMWTKLSQGSVAFHYQGEANNQVAMIRETVASGLPGLTYSPRVRNRTLWSVLFRLNEVLYFHCAPTNI
ncbi:hypothetical protein EDD16DRAFT_959289 [Pisolithus croceorrhizus]|nr:hypothetical protein EDD16DRAFT_959289 [Pisolithus croceorrhizus]